MVYCLQPKSVPIDIEDDSVGPSPNNISILKRFLDISRDIPISVPDFGYECLQRISCHGIQFAIRLKCLSPYQMNPHAKIIVFFKCSFFVNIILYLKIKIEENIGAMLEHAFMLFYPRFFIKKSHKKALFFLYSRNRTAECHEQFAIYPTKTLFPRCPAGI